MHSQVHAEEGGSICMICNKKIKRMAGMRIHMRDIHLGSNEDFHCPPCKKYFKAMQEEYSKPHPHLPQRLEKCQLRWFCCERVADINAMMHCSQCPGLEFPRNLFIGLHTFTVDDLMQSSAQLYHGRFKCMICEKQLSQKKHMRRHMRNIHLSSPRDYQCPWCKKYLKNKTIIYKHVRFFHKDKSGINYNRFIVKS